MADLHLDVYGVSLRLTGDREALDELAVHFHAFLAMTPAPSALVHIDLVRAEPHLDLPGRVAADQVVDRGVVYNRGDVTWVDHHGHASSRYDFGAEKGVIRAPRIEDLVELGYLMVHSRLGVRLERRGLYRLHCLGIVVAGRAALVLAPSGGGKSRLALAALMQTDALLLGDDLVLVDRSGCVHPFHSPIGVSSAEQGAQLGTTRAFPRRLHPPKWIVELPSLAPRLARAPVKAHIIAVARRVNTGPSRVVSARRNVVAGALWRDLVVGLGLPQVLELVARRGAADLVSLAPTAARRALAAGNLLRGARTVTLEVGSPESAVTELVSALSG